MSVLVNDYGLAPIAFSAFFNLLLGIFLLRTRAVSERLHLTLSQRWGMTILAWLFLINTVQLVVHSGWRVAQFSDPVLTSLFHCLELDLTLLSFLFLLAFGLVYPRPVARWNRLKLILGLLALAFVSLLFFQALYLTPKGIVVLQTPNPMVEVLYLVVTFVPIFLWLPEYEKQNSPHMRMILTILIWGYLFIHISYDFGVLFHALIYMYYYNYGIMVFTLTLMVLILIARSLYYRLGRWSVAEWTHIFLMIIALCMAIGHFKLLDISGGGIGPVRGTASLALLEFMTTWGGWCILRPALFFYALVRYQVFGTEVKASQSFGVIIAMMGASFFFILVFIALLRVGLMASLIGGAVIAIIMLIPLRQFSSNIVSRLLPMSAGGQKVPLAERRITYLMGLQTAVVGNEIDNKYDAKALDALRRALKVSEREHDLLISGFARERPLVLQVSVEEVYLFHMDGNLLGSARRGKEIGDEEKMDMIATMFTAVGEFSKDALRSGVGHMDAIEYGDSTLIIEVEGLIALGVMLKGRDNPEIRQRMRDLLMEVHDAYPKDLADLDRKEGLMVEGLEGRFKGLDKMLRKFLG